MTPMPVRAAANSRELRHGGPLQLSTGAPAPEEPGPPRREVAVQAGLSVPYIANLEKAHGNPTLDPLVRLADALGTHVTISLS